MVANSIDVGDLKARIDCQRLAEHLLGDTGKRSGKYVMYSNPGLSRQQQTPSFAVYVDGYKDHSRADDHGDCFGLIMLVKNCDFATAKQYAIEFIGGTIYSTPNLRVLPPPEQVTQQRHVSDQWRQVANSEVKRAADFLFSGAASAVKALAYLHDVRGLTDDTIRAARLGYNPGYQKTAIIKDDGKRAYLMPGIVIPWRDADRQLFAVRVRQRVGNLAEALEIKPDTDRDGSAAPKYKSLAGSRFDGTPYGTIIPGYDVLIVEGEFDALLAAQHAPDGLSVITAGAVSARLTPESIDQLSAVPRIFLALDNDDRGREGEQKWITALDKVIDRVSRVSMPDGVKDITEALLAGHSLDKLIGAAKPIIPIVQPDKDDIGIADVSRPVMTLAEARQYQTDGIRAYLDAEPDADHPSALLITTPPGVGKTFATWRALNIEATINNQRIAVLTPFRIDDPKGMSGAAYLAENNVSHLGGTVYFFLGRSPDHKLPSGLQGRSYCMQHARVNQQAAAGFDVYKSVCMSCPMMLNDECKTRNYLSQITAAHDAQIVVARHANLLDKELLKGRDIIVIDESMLAVSLRHFSYPPASLRRDQFITPTEHALLGDPEYAQMERRRVLINQDIKRLCSTIADVIESLPIPKHFPTPEENCIYGGRKLFSRVESRLNKPGEFARLISSARAFLETEEKHDLIVTDETSKSVMSNIKILLDFLIKEYTVFYRDAEQYPAWNSHLVAWRDHAGVTLDVYPFERPTISHKTKVIILDATGNLAIDRYRDALTTASGMPFAIQALTAEIERRALIVQITGSNFTKSTIKAHTLDTVKPKISQLIVDGDPIGDDFELPLLPDDFTTNIAAIENIKKLILFIFKLHGVPPVVLSYKDFIQKQLMPWGLTVGIPASNFIWFFSTKGRNDWKDKNIMISIGTPRIDEISLFTMAQVLHTNDPEPLDFTPRRVSKDSGQTLTYTDYLDKDGFPVTVKVDGYVDPRINTLFLNSIQEELTQGTYRTRLDTSEGERICYAITNFPFLNRVDILIDYRSFESYMTIRQLTLNFEFETITRTELIKKLEADNVLKKSAATELIDQVWHDLEAEGLGTVEKCFKRNPGRGAATAAFTKTNQT